MLFSQFSGFSRRFIKEVAVKNDIGAVSFGSGNFHKRSMFRHTDSRLTAVTARRQSHSLGVISGGSRNNASVPFFIRQSRHFIISTAKFERTRTLVVFQLQVYPAVRRPADRVRIRKARFLRYSLQSLPGFFYHW